MKLKVIAALLIIAVLFCSCMSSGKTQSGNPTPLLLRPDEASARQTIVFLIDSAAPDFYKKGTEIFSQQASRLTDGLLTVELRTTISPSADFTAKKGQLVFLDSMKDQSFSKDFSTLASPMIYKDYESFTMVLNSKKMLNMLEDGLSKESDIKLLGVFYSSSNYLVSSQPVTSGEIKFSPPPEDLSTAIVRSESSRISGVLQQYGYSVQANLNLLERISALEDGSAVLAEFSPEEILSTDWENKQLYPIVTNHSITPKWLAVSSETWQQLPDGHKSALIEASAYLYPIIDQGYLDQDSEVLRLLRLHGMREERSFTGLDKAADELREKSAIGERERYLISMLGSLE